jgi:hypothetical protein
MEQQKTLFLQGYTEVVYSRNTNSGAQESEDGLEIASQQT